MKRCLLCLALLCSATSTIGQEYLPRDVQRFVDRWERCDHTRGEIRDPIERHRMNEESRELYKFCGGAGKELDRMKQKYAANSTITQILNQFDPGIDALEVPGSKGKKSRQSE